MPDDGDFYPRDRRWHPPAFAPGYKTSVTRSPRLPLISLTTTESERRGPAFGQNAFAPGDNDLLTNFAQPGESPVGERIILHGRVLDENARPVAGTLVEIWQANASGRYRHKKDGYLGAMDPNFGGCGRALTGSGGEYAFRTVKPGAYPWRNDGNDWRPAHIHVSVFGSGFAQRLITQLYFEGDPLIARCPIANTIADPVAVDMLVAKLDMPAAVPLDCLAYRFDIVLRGRRSTHFENRPEGN